MPQGKRYRGFFVFEYKDGVRLVFHASKTAPFLRMAVSKDGRKFRISSKPAEFLSETGKPEHWNDLSHCHVTSDGKQLLLTALRETLSSTSLIFAISSTGSSWKSIGESTAIKHPAVVLRTKTGARKKSYLVYAATGRKFIELFVSSDLEKWEERGVVLKPREHHFDALSLSPLSVSETKQGIVLIYIARDGYGHITVGAALFDRDRPEVLLWRSSHELFSAPVTENGNNLRFIGGIDRRKYFYVYLERDGEIEAFPMAKYWETYVPGKFPRKTPRKSVGKEKTILEHCKLVRYEANPIIEPQVKNAWESFATFNPAVISSGGLIHLLYRAQGPSGLSVLGYAASHDGYTICYRSKYPAYIPRELFEAGLGYINPRAAYSPYMSGGGYGGVEDPKMTIIDDRVYLTYVAYDGWSPPRIAFSWIPITDFLKHQWKRWSKPVLISPPGIVDKSAAILPEKINGKYVIFHRIFPNIFIDFVDSFDEFDGKTRFLRGEYVIPPRKDSWDCAKLSVGAPPIKTEHGWLIIYNAVTGLQEESGSDMRYKIGAMLLDLKTPNKVLTRSHDPILEPETEYENNGHKYGIIYSCGATVKDGTLFVYYGASDKTLAVATAPLEKFLKDLMTDKPARLKKVKLE